MNMETKEFDDLVKAVKDAVMNAWIFELEKRQNRRVQAALTWETLKESARDVLDPKPAEEPISVTTVTPSYQPKFDPDAFPKLKTRYGPDMDEQRKLLSRLSGEKALEHLKKLQSQSFAASAWFIASNPEQELPFHSWRTEPMDRLEQLKADGVPEYQPPKKGKL